jgi:hypothetical protein
MLRVKNFVLIGTIVAALAVAAEPASWRSLKLAGHTLALVDESRVERYRLAEGGGVLATLGEPHGAMTAPLWHWRHERDMLVIADSPEATPRETFLLLEVRGSDLRVRRMSGAPATFSLSPSR